MEDNNPVNIGDLLGKYASKRAKKGSEWGSVLDLFITPLNVSRGTKFKPLTHARLARVFKGMSKQELYVLLSNCNQAKNFSAYFWWWVKQKKVDK